MSVECVPFSYIIIKQSYNHLCETKQLRTIVVRLYNLVNPTIVNGNTRLNRLLILSCTNLAYVQHINSDDTLNNISLAILFPVIYAGYFIGQDAYMLRLQFYVNLRARSFIFAYILADVQLCIIQEHTSNISSLHHIHSFFLYNYILIYIDKKSKEQQIDDMYTKKMASQLQFLGNFLGKLT